MVYAENSPMDILFQDAEADAGRIGVLIVFAGMLGSVLCGIILDKYHRFK